MSKIMTNLFSDQSDSFGFCSTVNSKFSEVLFGFYESWTTTFTWASRNGVYVTVAV